MLLQDCPEHIIGSRFVLQGFNIRNSSEEAEVVTQLRKVCHDSKFNVTVFHPYFIYFDQVKRLLFNIFTKFALYFLLVFVGSSHNSAIYCCSGHDGCSLDIRPKSSLLSLGGIFNCIYRTQSPRIHDFLGHQFGCNIYDQSHHAHGILCGFCSTYILS